jgi:hypothetical protein
MPLGLFAPLPLRLGGSAEEGWSAADHARVCADLVLLKKSAPLAVWTFTKVGATVTIHDYYGLNGAGAVYAPDDISLIGTGAVGFNWSIRLFEDPYQVVHPLSAKHGKVSGHGSTSLRGDVVVVANGVSVYTFNGAGAAADGKATVALW